MSSLSLLGLILIGLGVIISIVIIIVVVIAVCSNNKSSSSQAAYQAYTPPQPVQQDNAAETAPVTAAVTPCDTPEKTTLAEAIKNHRIRCGMTQEQVAEAMEVSRQAVSKWETGAAEPSTSNLLALAKLFGISAAELLDGIE